jgi:hypothetical protein
MSTQAERQRTVIEGTPIELASDLSCIPVVTWREGTPAAASSTTTPVLNQAPAAAPTLRRDNTLEITLEPLALILARPSGVERLPLGDGRAPAAASTQAGILADRMPESTRQACVDAVFGAPVATAGGFRVALRRVAARLSLEPDDPRDWRIEILSSEALEDAAIAGGAGRPALGMSAEGVYH